MRWKSEAQRMAVMTKLSGVSGYVKRNYLNTNEKQIKFAEARDKSENKEYTDLRIAQDISAHKNWLTPTLQRISAGSLKYSINRYNDKYFDKSNIRYFGAKSTSDNYLDTKNKRFIFGEVLTTNPDGKPRYTLGYMNDDQKGNVRHKTFESKYDYQKARNNLIYKGDTNFIN
jgi:hypothetical protein